MREQTESSDDTTEAVSESSPPRDEALCERSCPVGLSWRRSELMSILSGLWGSDLAARSGLGLTEGLVDLAEGLGPMRCSTSWPLKPTRLFLLGPRLDSSEEDRGLFSRDLALKVLSLAYVFDLVFLNAILFSFNP